MTTLDVPSDHDFLPLGCGRPGLRQRAGANRRVQSIIVPTVESASMMTIRYLRREPIVVLNAAEDGERHERAGRWWRLHQLRVRIRNPMDRL